MQTWCCGYQSWGKHPGGSPAASTMCLHTNHRSTHQTTKFSFESECAVEQNWISVSRSWRNALLNQALGEMPLEGARGVPLPLLPINGSELILVNKTKSETKANFRQEPGNLQSY